MVSAVLLPAPVGGTSDRRRISMTHRALRPDQRSRVWTGARKARTELFFETGLPDLRRLQVLAVSQVLII